MNQGGDAAEQIVRMTLNGVEVVGKMASNDIHDLLKALFKELKSAEKTKGKASLMTMMKSKTPINVFEVRDKDLKQFCQAAKKYGVLYHVMKDRNSTDGKCDIMVRASDSAQVNRIFERFGLCMDNKATIRANLDRDAEKQSQEKTEPQMSAEEKFIEELFKKDKNAEKNYNENPSMAKTAPSHPSEPFSKTRSSQVRTRDDSSSRPSVRLQLNEIKEERKKSAAAQAKVPQKPKSRTKAHPERTR